MCRLATGSTREGKDRDKLAQDWQLPNYIPGSRCPLGKQPNFLGNPSSWCISFLGVGFLQQTFFSWETGQMCLYSSPHLQRKESPLKCLMHSPSCMTQLFIYHPVYWIMRNPKKYGDELKVWLESDTTFSWAICPLQPHFASNIRGTVKAKESKQNGVSTQRSITK